MKFTPILAAALTAAGLAFAPPLAAQQSQMEISAEDVTDQQLESFVVAVLAVDKVRAEYIPQIEAASSDDRKQELVNEANDHIYQSIEATDGITVDEYIAIAQASQEDPELSQRIVSRVEDARE